MNKFKLRAEYFGRIRTLVSRKQLTPFEGERYMRTVNDAELLASWEREQAKKRKRIPQASSVSSVRVRASVGATTVSIFGDIENDTVTSVRSALTQAAGKPVTVEIDSPGGNAFSGLAIHDLLKAYSGQVTAIVTNAFSAASTIAMGAGRILMRPNGFWMAHGSTIETESGETTGGQDRLATKIDARMVDVYSSRLSRWKVRSLMAEEEFLTAQECVSLGIADGILTN